MASRDNTYSRFVAIAKVVLPMAAIGILSTFFLFSRNISPEDAIPFAEVDVDQMLREQRVNAPRYASVDGDGTAIEIVAASAIPDIANPKRAEAEGIEAVMDFENGAQTRVSARNGVIDSGLNQAELSGAVRINTSDGYQIETDTLLTKLNTVDLVAPGAVQVLSPLGTLTAGQMRLSKPSDKTGYLLVFNEGVKLVYKP